MVLLQKEIHICAVAGGVLCLSRGEEKGAINPKKRKYILHVCPTGTPPDKEKHYQAPFPRPCPPVTVPSASRSSLAKLPAVHGHSFDIVWRCSWSAGRELHAADAHGPLAAEHPLQIRQDGSVLVRHPPHSVFVVISCRHPGNLPAGVQSPSRGLSAASAAKLGRIELPASLHPVLEEGADSVKVSGVVACRRRVVGHAWVGVKQEGEVVQFRQSTEE